MSSRLLFTLITTCFFSCALAQKEANNWFFGIKAGLSFDSNQPVPINESEILAPFGCASISDKETGKLLFYTNGEIIWNRDHSIMKFGADLSGDTLASQSSLIVPVPGNENQYYLFTLSGNVNIKALSKLYFNLIDMTLDNGKGAIVKTQKNVLLIDGLVDKMTAVRQPNSSNFWLITHEGNSNKFVVFKINQSGVNFSGKYAVGSVSITGGNLKASPNGKRLAITQESAVEALPFEMFDFDPSTGRISNAMILGHFISQFGVSFSPDNSKLYLDAICDQCPGEPDFLYQFDLNDNDIANSVTGLVTNNPLIDALVEYSRSFAAIALQNAPDGRMYSAGSYRSDMQNISNNLLVINNPNARGIGCDIEVRPINFSLGFARHGLPNFIESTFNGLTPTDNPNAPCSEKYSLKLKPNPVEQYIELEITERCFSPYYLTIYDIPGKTIDRYFISDQNSGKIDVSRLASGVYLAVIELPAQQLIKRFIKF